MNANELAKDRADILADELLAYHHKGVCGRAAKMLRKQQAEIEALKAHPVKEYKEPSVKEIDDLWLSVINNIPTNDHRPREWHFAKAILRKAQEK